MKQKLIKKGSSGMKADGFWDTMKNAAMGAAVAENPSVMTANGWQQNDNGNWEQSQLNNSGVKQLRNNLSKIGAAGIIGASLPYIPAIAANPYVQTYFTADGLKTAAGSEGIQKTINLLKNKQYARAAVSGVNDLVNVSGGSQLMKPLKIFNSGINESKSLLQKIPEIADVVNFEGNLLNN